MDQQGMDKNPRLQVAYKPDKNKWPTMPQLKKWNKYEPIFYLANFDRMGEDMLIPHMWDEKDVGS